MLKLIGYNKKVSIGDELIRLGYDEYGRGNG
jgi:hypothetical protein